ncbi:hypothetical protein TWF191_001009 [Orbilia oligospora]|uniref:Uncharacterized protein n=2 Tax=Orbilia oligospora TaxID=2813651 RepID=A0A7C8QCP4_ORBOL|nr:hypothetical protein TWF191_001009 [Orbilia oligospora]
MIPYNFTPSTFNGGFKINNVPNYLADVENFITHRYFTLSLYTIVSLVFTISIFTFFPPKKRVQFTPVTMDIPQMQSPKDGYTPSNYRHLYHHLQNPESHPAAKLHAWKHLHQLFDITLSKALFSSSPTILSIPKYSRINLTDFLSTAERNTLTQWTSYLSRRSSGGKPEMILNRSHASHFLRLAAPAKYVDGVWLSGLHRSNTPLNLRPITRIAWQILSEELGDGDIARNHVYVYSQLLKSLDHMTNLNINTTGTANNNNNNNDNNTAGVPGADSQLFFIDESQSPGKDINSWIAAIAQLSLGMFPQELLPEILGFNLAYEAVTLETLVCAHELRELRLDPTYFNLHVTIDNADSGHTAMALHAVIELMKTCESVDEEDSMWRRVQAGYTLAQGLSVNPCPLTQTELDVLEIFSNKCGAATSAHLRCKAHIGGAKGMKLGEWMDPEKWEGRKYTFLEVLGSSSWVVPGKPEESRLIQEILWKGRMFGAFTVNETTVLKNWILEMLTMSAVERFEREIEESKGSYIRFVGSCPPALKSQDIDPVHHTTLETKFEDPVLPEIPEIPSELPINIVPRDFDPCELLLATAIPLQHYLSSSTKSATQRGMTVLKILRVLNGLADVGNLIAGMDEVTNPSGLGAMELAQKLHTLKISQVQPMKLELDTKWNWLNSTSLAPESNFCFLIGVQYALVFLMHSPEAFGVMNEEVSTKMQEISIRVKEELDCLGFRLNEESKRGFWMTINTVIRET